MATRVLLGHNQQFTVNGSALDGVREVEVEVSTRSVEVTGWNAAYASTLPVVIDASLTVTLYYPDEVAPFWVNLSTHPKQKMDLAITGLVEGPFIVSDISVGCPMGDVVPHRITFKQWVYE